MEKAGASLRLQALTNRLIKTYATDSSEEPDAELAALRLFALTAKSLECSRFAPANARDLVRRHHYAAMCRLKEAAAASFSGRETGTAALAVEQGQRLKQLRHALRECSSKELGKVRNSRVAKRIVGMFGLGSQALHQWEQSQRRRGGSSRTARAALSPPSSPSGRGKRKTPERPAAGRSRFGLECSGEGGMAAGGSGEHPWRRRSSDDSEQGQRQDTAGLLPKQLQFCSAGCSEGQAAGDVCAEWAGFKAFLASPRRPAPGFAAAAMAATNSAQTTASLASAACPAPMAVVDGGTDLGQQQQQQQQQGVGCSSGHPEAERQAGQQAVRWGEQQPMDMDELPSQGEAGRSLLAEVLAASGDLQLLPPVTAEPRSPLQPTRGKLMAQPLTPDKLGPWGLLLLPSPAPPEKENASWSDGSGSTSSSNGSSIAAATISSRPAALATLRPIFSHTRGTQPLHASSRLQRLQHAAEAAEVLAADVSMLICEAAGSGDGSNCAGRQQKPCSEAPQTFAALPVPLPVPLPLPLPLPMHQSPAEQVPLRRRFHPSPSSQNQQPHPEQQQQGQAPSSGPTQGKLMILAGQRILMCDHSVLRRAAAQAAPHAGGDLDVGSTFYNLNAHGRADSILRTVDLPGRMGQQLRAA